ncbi:YdaU family protein [Aminobacter sp. UC22_36]|uniref:YdaU family protein n=1 Tax=Aminobacter sp. UC22_36 TaxID=3374549 RepID=UPI0037579132
MSEMPWVRFFASDWLAGTRGMSAAETGIYITLVASMYERGEAVPEDHARLARLCGASNATFKTVLETLVAEGKISRVAGGLWNRRVEKEGIYRQEKSAAGKQAASARWQKSQHDQASAAADVMPPPCPGTASQKPDARTEKQEPAGSSKKRGCRLRPDFCPDMADAHKAGLSLDEAGREAEKFRDYWISQAGQKGVKLDWAATWRNWCRHAAERRPRSPPQRKRSFVDVAMDRFAGASDGPESLFGNHRNVEFLPPDIRQP